MNNKPLFHCAIYTRKSSEEGLEQDFNSLHAQRDACTAYITSQMHEGWRIIKTHYDDGGFSGGNMERPALKNLLSDIDEGKVNIVVVYKVDRLTRSLTDFAKIIDCFDRHGVSFVSVTQQFNTTSSMGRLTLNVLLSFAQFEREVTGERIRDKIAASKKKGIWMGGPVPLGYNLENRKLLINEKEAKIVRYIFRRYLDLGCVRILKEHLDIAGIYTKGKGCKFSRGTLYKILSNPLYIGLIRHKGNCYQGQQPAIIDHVSWEKVQHRLAGNASEHRKRITDSCPLTNKLYDISGERLVPCHSNKRGRRYLYYISESLRGNPKETSLTGWRLPGQEIEQVIAHAAMELIHDEVAVTTAFQESGIAAHDIVSILNTAGNLSLDEADIISRFVQRVELSKEGIHLTLSLASLLIDSKDVTITHYIPMKMRRRGVEMRLILNGAKPVRVDQLLLKTIVRAHQWFNDLVSGRVKNMSEIVSREGLDKSYVSRVITLAFLAPDIVENIVTGRQPADLSVEKLLRKIDLPLAWENQHQLLN
ncbi:MAG: recombinase family protein [Syntrophaceae bacterium]|nr:recombinase family protein [Syntrophaceae bacterium]